MGGRRPLVDGDVTLSANTIDVRPKVLCFTERMHELIDCIENLRPRDGFIKLAIHWRDLSTHVLLEGLCSKMGRLASSTKVVQGTIKLCWIKVSVSAILYQLARFIANPEKMRIDEKVGPALREIDGRDRVAFKVGLGIARACEKNVHRNIRRCLTLYR
jgi:hypothetical protein